MLITDFFVITDVHTKKYTYVYIGRVDENNIHKNLKEFIEGNIDRFIKWLDKASFILFYS